MAAQLIHDRVEMECLEGAYIKWGPYQIELQNYPFCKEKHPRHFQCTWFKMFLSGLEYSPSNDRVYCLLCYLFSTKQSDHFWIKCLNRQGFRSCRKVNAGKIVHFLITLEIVLAHHITMQ